MIAAAALEDTGVRGQAEVIVCLSCRTPIAHRWPVYDGKPGRCKVLEGVTPVDVDERGRFTVWCPQCGARCRFSRWGSRLT